MPEGSASPVDRLLGGYLLLACAALLFPHRPPAWPLLLLGHVAGAALLLGGGMARVRAAENRAVAAIVAWYPLLLVPFLYWELPFFINAVWGGRFFDATALAWEAALLGYQPSLTLAARWDSRLLSETLHLAYLSYYPVIYLFPAMLYRRDREAFDATLFALMLGFTASYLLFIAFPVQGPRFLFPAPGGAAAEGPVFDLTHTILESGSSRGAAFPSAHAAVAVVQTVNALRYLPALTPVLALLTAGIVIGAVYGGFHYAVDMAAGVALGAVVAIAAPAAWRALR